MDGQEAVAHGYAVRLDSQGKAGKVVNISTRHLRRLICMPMPSTVTDDGMNMSFDPFMPK